MLDQASDSGGSVPFMVNGQVGAYFRTMKGLRQGDPLSPIFFDIAQRMFINGCLRFVKN
jgi:hypothetical protein